MIAIYVDIPKLAIGFSCQVSTQVPVWGCAVSAVASLLWVPELAACYTCLPVLVASVDIRPV